ncbi:MAG: hypothetical protein ACOYMN_22160 [Roseimicrobium sp.]
MNPEDASLSSARPTTEPPSGAPPQRTTGGNMKWTPPSPEHLQRMLPAYEVISKLGQGGMGAVYKAQQKSLKRPVAIKIVPPEAAPQGVKRTATKVDQRAGQGEKGTRSV